MAAYVFGSYCSLLIFQSDNHIVYSAGLECSSLLEIQHIACVCFCACQCAYALAKASYTVPLSDSSDHCVESIHYNLHAHYL